MQKTAEMRPLETGIAEVGHRLERLRDEMRDTPMYLRRSQAYLDRAAEKQKLMGRLEALRQLARLS